jgi:hypothetical protein
VFEGLLKDKVELEDLRNKFKRSFERNKIRTFILFPPMAKKSINNLMTSNSDDDEESKFQDSKIS